MTKTDTNEEKIDELLSRSINAVYPSKEELKKFLLSGKRLTIYNGIDPTAPYAHLGHAMNYHILKGFQNLGHRIIVLVGDFTAMIGDPTDKSSARIRLSKEQVKENLKNYKKQIGKILDFSDKKNPPEFMMNSKWLSKLTFEDVAEIASNFTVQNMIERDTFQKRLKEEKPLYLHEFFYPLMQGYDSVAMETDAEIGGTDQLFNMLAGRTLVKRYLDKEKFVITHPLLENPKTGEILMSKSAGTGISLADEPNDMYGKVMALPDEAIELCFRHCTNIPLGEIEKISKSMSEGANPRDYKMRLAHEIVSMYHNEKKADEAGASFNKTFSKGEMPSGAKEVKVKEGLTLQDVLVSANLVESNTAYRRLISEGAIKLLNKGEETVSDPKFVVGEDLDIRIGKKRFLKIRI